MRSLQAVGLLTLCAASCNQALAQFVPPITIPGSITWSSMLNDDTQDSIIWEANMEPESLFEWYDANLGAGPENEGGGVYITDSDSGGDAVAFVSNDFAAHTGRFSVRTDIDGATLSNSVVGDDGPQDCLSDGTTRAVRLMRWLDAEGNGLPKAAYYSAFIYIPENYDPNRYAPWGTPGCDWWIVFQFKSQNMTNEQTASDPNENKLVYALNIYNPHEQHQSLGLYLWSALEEKPYFQKNSKFKPLPTKQWVHIEALYKAKSDNTGKILVWQDGKLIFDRKNVQTLVTRNDRHVFGLANYTEHVDGGEANGSTSLYFDDVIISKKKVHPELSKLLP